MEHEELWREVKGFNGFYEVSNLGRVRSVTHFARNNINGGMRIVKGSVLTPYKMPNGYLQVQLCKGEKRNKYYVHRLVAEAFIKNDSHLPEVNHIDCNKSNNSTDNLEWTSHRNNQIHTIEMGASKKAKPVLCTLSNKKYRSVCEAVNETGISHYMIRKLCEKGIDWRWLKRTAN